MDTGLEKHMVCLFMAQLSSIPGYTVWVWTTCPKVVTWHRGSQSSNSRQSSHQSSALATRLTSQLVYYTVLCYELSAQMWNIFTTDHSFTWHSNSHAHLYWSSCTVSSHFAGTQFLSIPLRVGGCVGLGGLLHTKVVCLPEGGHPSQY